MHTLITDLLALSRVGTRGQAFEPADLDTVLDQALDGLGASIKETGARITRDPLPTLRVDAGQMVQLFQNLIGNALKFRGERAPGNPHRRPAKSRAGGSLRCATTASASSRNTSSASF